MRTAPVIAAAIATVGLVAGCTAGGPDDDAVTFTVSGTGTASNVTILNGSSQSQDSQATLPYSKTLPAQGNYLHGITAQNSGGGGQLTCEIRKGEKVLATNTSTGPYAVVSCNGNG